jgi:N-acetylglucosamine-6-phosphate deacetylase
LVTLAPEETSQDTIERLVKAGVVVSAGHSNAPYPIVRAALGHGVSGFTHLFNAMSPLTSREPGVVGAALEDASAWCGIIVDGVHVDPVVLKLALRLRPHERFNLITDAMPCVGSAETSFQLQGKTISVRDGACFDDEGTLAGSALDMAGAVRNAVSMLGLELADASRMASRNPAEFLGLDHELGRIARGYFADLVLLDDHLQVLDTWIHGHAGAEAAAAHAGA